MFETARRRLKTRTECGLFLIKFVTLEVAMRSLVVSFLLGTLGFCAAARSLDNPPEYGPDPRLPEPQHTIVPTVKVAPAKCWLEGTAPSAAEELQVATFAKGLDHPRWLYVLPNGDVLVAETDAPQRPENGKGIKAWFRAPSSRSSSPPLRERSRQSGPALSSAGLDANFLHVG